MLYLLKVGELMLKKGNRKRFEQVLKSNIRLRLPQADIQYRSGRCYVFCKDPALSAEYFEERLACLPGITGFAPVYSCPKDDASLAEQLGVLAAKQVAIYGPHSTFRIHVRRTDKSLARNSQSYAAWLGSIVLEQFPNVKVDLRAADWSVKLELREKAYLYHSEFGGVGGLPVGSSGRAMLLLSGGIDSPVAGYLMAQRGMHLEAVYFDTPPFTTEAAYNKVQQLAARLAKWTSSGGKLGNAENREKDWEYPDQQKILLHRVPFTELQLALRKQLRRPAALTLQGRACMILLAQKLANQKRAGRSCQALISGEALSQVASQTIENLSYTNSFAALPILRPLIGFDKEQIIAISRKIDCFDISIQPHVDCCSYFAPQHPIIKAHSAELRQELEQVPQLETLLSSAFHNTETIAIAPHWYNRPRPRGKTREI